ncbi:hypothetical protein Pcinc_039571 [Petrolisthes cinctipes]|uniref:Uncharacterized protein n=1 Tax=Petrolisthes cinctipes TaxID=88211 RepID=A0AAE1BNE6_PETCI|nr:hypothetical protein Pcinc_039571 [Petrolisthes cinctipes]
MDLSKAGSNITPPTNLGTKVAVADLKGEKVPDNWVVDKAGRNTQDPSQLLRQGEHYCLWGGGPHGKDVAWKTDLDRQSDISHCFIAINPEMFAEGFQERLSDLMAQLRDVEPWQLATHLGVEPIRTIN